MKTLPFSLLAGTFLAAAGSLLGAPATELPQEWFVPLESTTGFALVDSGTGQVRFQTVSSGNVLAQLGPVETHLPTVSGLSSGYFSSGVENIIISSESANGISFAPRNGTPPIAVQGSEAGPVTTVPIALSGDPSGVLIHSRYAGSGHGLEYIATPTATPVLGERLDGLADFAMVQPLREPGTTIRRAVGLYSLGPTPTLYNLFRFGSNSINGTAIGNMASGSRLATEVLGSDGRTCTLGYVPGTSTVQIATHPFSGFAQGIVTAPALSFPIGSISQVSAGIPNAPDGVLITSQSGSTAVYARVLTGSSLSIQATFTPTAGQVLNGLVPVPGRGFIALQGSASNRETTGWRLFRNSGSGWAQVNSGALSPWLAPATDFATLFWFNSTPLVDPMARLLKLETRPDWTNGAGSLPTSLTAETFISSAAGLDNPSAFSPTAPAGANYVMANQYLPSVSISALADNRALLSPSVALSPASGTYTDAVTVSALYDDGALSLYYREADDPDWNLYQDPLTIGYPTELLFYARENVSGKAGPILSRSYNFSVPLNEIDSDGDSIPDYVEEHYGLDPAAGADSDLDFHSDLEEILAGTDPRDPTDRVPPGTRNPPYLGEGFYLYAQAFNQTTGSASPFNNAGTPADPTDDFPGERIESHDLRAKSLASGNVQTLTTGGLSGQNAARLDITHPVAEREWIILSSPLFFNLGTALNGPRNGRETYRVLQRPTFPEVAVVTTPSGNNRSADVVAWVAAATSAHGSFSPVAAVTRIDPEDNAIAVMAEQAIHSSLLGLASELLPGEYAALGIPADVADFTLFAARSFDSGKVPLSEEMITALFATGCDFSAMLSLLDTGGRASADILNLSNQIYGRHAAVSASRPNMALPLDALRSVLRTGTITDPGAVVALTYHPMDDTVLTSTTRPNPYNTISPTLISNARAAMLSLLSGIAATKRPVETWTVEIEAATTLGHSYDYRRSDSGNNLAWFVDSFGERFILEQGLGLNLGASFTVRGYTDVDPVAGFDTMEIISIEMVVNPIATDSDTNANLLDDEWERFFFGNLGIHSPFDLHPTSGHSYLQYHVSGADPRAGDLTDPVVNLTPLNPSITWLPTQSAYEISWEFPDAYIGAFDFTLNASTDLGDSDPFAGPVEVTPVYMLSMGHYAMRVSGPESSLSKNFFQVEMSLAE